MGDQKVDDSSGPVEPGRRAAVRRILIGSMVLAVPAVLSFSIDSLAGGAEAQPLPEGPSGSIVQTALYAVLDVGSVGSIVHHVVRIDMTDPNNIAYVPVGTIAGFADKYFVSATLDPVSSTLFFALSDSDSTTSVESIYLYGVTFPDLVTVTPFCESNGVFVNLSPQATYNTADGLFYYAVNNDPFGFDYVVETIDSSGTIVTTSITTTDIQNSNNGLQIFNDTVYATTRLADSFAVYYAGIADSTTGSITSPITPQPPGQIWSTFGPDGVLWGTTQYGASTPQSYSLYRLQCTTAGVPAASPFTSELVGTMPLIFEANVIVNMALFASVAPPSDNIFADGFDLPG